MAYVSSVESIGIKKGIEQGLQQGMEQGREQGREQGKDLALQKLLVKRFGISRLEISARLDKATFAMIEIWFDRAIDAPSLDAVFTDTPPSAH